MLPLVLRVRAADKMTIADIGGTADVGFYVADAKRFLKEEGIFRQFSSSYQS